MTTISKMNDSKNVISKAVFDLEKLETEATSWTQNEYARSNDGLYNILTECYRIWRMLENSSKARDVLVKRMKDKNLATRQVTPLVTIIVRLTFNTNRKRAYIYATTLQIAKSEGVEVSQLAGWIRDKGGIEEVSRMKPDDNGKTGINRHDEAKAYLEGLKAIATLNGDVEGILDDEDADFVLLVGRKRSDGVDVLRGIGSSSLVALAITNLYKDLNLPSSDAQIENKAASVSVEEPRADEADGNLLAAA